MFCVLYFESLNKQRLFQLLINEEQLMKRYWKPFVYVLASLFVVLVGYYLLSSRTTKLTGDVFLATEGGTAIKPPLLEINFIPDKTVKSDVITIQTDADGKFNVDLPRGKYTISAIYHGRGNFATWFLNFTASEADQKLSLNNSNADKIISNPY